MLSPQDIKSGKKALKGNLEKITAIRKLVKKITRNKRLPIWIMSTILTGAFLSPPPAVANDLTVINDFQKFEIVSDHDLDSMRGGFNLGSLGILRFSIDFAANIDNTPIYDGGLSFDGTTFTNTLTIHDPTRGNVTFDNALGQITAAVQNGGFNTSPGSFSQAGGAFNIVQNSQSNIVIQQITSIAVDLMPGTIAASRNMNLMTRVLDSSLLGIQ